MLYVKVDDQGNPLKEAESFQEVINDNLKRNTIIPRRFTTNPEDFSYAFVPANVETPENIFGKKIVADIPVRQSDGTFQRTWKYIDDTKITSMSDEELDQHLRRQRKSYLHKFADSISPLRWEKWSEEEKQEVRDWYESVLSMTDDPQWPRMVLPRIPAPLKKSEPELTV